MVSVLMPVYNAERYLEAAIDSILDQTLRDFELIVVDDGSTDATAAIVARYASQDGRVKFIQQNHGGHSAALNLGLRHCRHPWVAIMDADDIALPRRLERQLEMTTDGSGRRRVGERRLSHQRARRDSEQFSRRSNDEGRMPAAAPRRPDRAGDPSDGDAQPRSDDQGGRLRRDLRCVRGHGAVRSDAGYGDLVTIPEPLVKYRVHGSSLSMTRAVRIAMLRRFILARQRHRRATGKELTLEQFKAEDGKRPLTVRLRDWQIMKGNLLYRQGGLYYGERRYVKAVARPDRGYGAASSAQLETGLDAGLFAAGPPKLAHAGIGGARRQLMIRSRAPQLERSAAPHCRLAPCGRRRRVVPQYLTYFL